MDAKKKILIVVDMQNDFISGSLGTDRGKEIVPRVKELISSWTDPIIATQDTHYGNYLETSEGRHLPVPHCIFNTTGWEIESTIKDEILKKSPRKFRFLEKQAFGNYFLLPKAVDGLLEASGEDIEITVVGLCTDICVVSNVLILKAYFPEAEIKVDASCCGGVTLEKHKAALEVMKSCQIEILNEEL